MATNSPKKKKNPRSSTTYYKVQTEITGYIKGKGMMGLEKYPAFVFKCKGVIWYEKFQHEHNICKATPNKVIEYFTIYRTIER